MKLVALPKTDDEIIHDKIWQLIEEFGQKFPDSTMKIEVEYPSHNKYTVEHVGASK